MKRVLVFGMTENPGGIESFLVNFYRNINRTEIQFDFLCNSYNPVAYEDELIELGARTFHIVSRRENRKRFRNELNNVFKAHANEWSAIWVNVCSLANVDYLKLAKKYGIPKRIIHSHNSENMDSRLRGILHLINKTRISNYATDFWACSEEAAHWFYDGSIMGKAVIIHNAIDTEKMQFDSKKRDRIRKQYGLEKKYVIGNVGRLHFQKNQIFAIDTFKHFRDKHPNSMLVFVGQGEDEKRLKERVARYNLSESVIFAGVQKDIQGWLSSFDLFLFPSLFEGLSIVALEAQSNGLPILASNGVIPEEVKMTDNFVFCDLNKGAKLWSDTIDEMFVLSREDFSTIKSAFIRNGFDIKNEAKKLEEMLLRNE